MAKASGLSTCGRQCCNDVPRPPVPSDLARFRRRAVALIAWSLAIGDGALAVLLPMSQPTTQMDITLLAVSACVHVAVALTVGRTWQPESWWGCAYLLTLVGLTTLAWIEAGDASSDTFWFFLVPIGLSAFANALPRHVVITGVTVAAYIGGGLVGPGLTAPTVLPRLVALFLFASILWILTDNLARALERAEGARLELEAHLAEAQSVNERLKELDRLKDDFVSTASHELRTPLTVILGFTQTMNAHWDRLDEPQRREMGERIEARARGLTSILDTMLDTARIQRGTLEAEPGLVMVGEAIAASIERTQPLLRHHELTVGGDLDLDVVADAQLLERVLDNLLANAARHTPAGTRVQVVVERASDGVVLRVADDGPGIEPHEVERLGEAFYRAGDKDRRAREGVGLGLALVRQVLAAHGSELEICSEFGVGTTFSFALPTQPAPAKALELQSTG